MNQLAIELARQAGVLQYQDNSVKAENLKKFLELIVEECDRQCKLTENVFLNKANKSTTNEDVVKYQYAAFVAREFGNALKFNFGLITDDSSFKIEE